MATQYILRAPKTPGAQPSDISAHVYLAEARKAARAFRDRRDLTNQDVRIERVDGQLVEYAGPNR